MNVLITGDKQTKDILKGKIKELEEWNKIWYDRSMMLSKMLDKSELKVKKLKEKLKEKRK